MRNYRKPYRIKKKKPVYKNRFFWLISSILIIVAGIFYFLFFSPFFQVEKIIISGNEKILKEDIEKIISREAEKEIFFSPTRAIFLLDSTKVKESILNNFPKISEVEINKKLPDIIELKIIERTGVLTWREGEKFFLIDDEGVIFEEITGDLAETIKIQDLSRSSELKLGEKALNKQKIDKILEIKKKLEELKIPFQEILIISEERLNIKTVAGWEIYFNIQNDILWQATKLATILEKELPPEKRGNLEYIELRFGNLASYKYRENQAAD